MWKRYRFKTRSVEDYRPLIFDARFPWWCSGVAGDDSSATIIAWLLGSEDLLIYWDDAFEIESAEHEQISFSDRFPKPEWFEEYQIQ